MHEATTYLDFFLLFLFVQQKGERDRPVLSMLVAMMVPWTDGRTHMHMRNTFFREKVSPHFTQTNKTFTSVSICVFEARPLYSQQKGTDITDHGLPH